MCDFRAGDEVICVDDANARCLVAVGAKYIVHDVYERRARIYCRLVGVTAGDWATAGMRVTRFRKVQKRNSSLSIEAFLTIKPGGFEEKVQFPVKRKKTDAFYASYIRDVLKGSS